jgi:hypothetical protein
MEAVRPLGMSILADSDGKEELILLFADRQIRLPIGVLESVAAASADPQARDSLITEYFEAYIRRPRIKRSRRTPRGARCDRRRRTRARAGDLDGAGCRGRASDDHTDSVEQAAWSLGTLIRSALAQTTFD